MLVFPLVTIWFQRYVGIGELVVVILLWANHLRTREIRRKEIERYIQSTSANMDTASKDTMLNAPIPMVIFRPESEEIIWNNEPFNRITGEVERAFDAKLETVVPNFSTQWLLDGKKECPEEVELGGRRYHVYGHIARTGEEQNSVLLATTYWVDVTEFSKLKEDYAATRPVAMIIAIDNYEELFKGVTDKAKSAVLASIDEKISQWTDPAHGMLCKYDRDRYIFLFAEEHMPAFQKDKFSVQEEVRQIVAPNSINATLSLGIGRDAADYGELFQFASLALEMALSRGGDQAVVKNRFNFEFFGGRNRETERHTEVKSRVMASALGELIGGSSGVFVVGHKNSDLDALGAATGICAIARKKGVPAYILQDGPEAPCAPLQRRLATHPLYEKAFISAQDALVAVDPNSVLVVVDTNRPEMVLAPELLESCTKVAVIDHHRRAATYIANAALNFHEPSASSASELVVELMGYLLEPKDVLRCEAESLLAGIVLDTKNFTMRTGGRTFEAAAYLRRLGADTADVKKLFQNDLSGTVARYAIIQEARMVRDNIAMATVSGQCSRVVAAQAADELLNVSGVEASFVLYVDGERISISGRSMGNVNVQVVLEALGGGGNAMIAGAQLEGATLEQAQDLLLSAIDNYLSDDN
jgi:c-di-AMP phosphodiesterase-like protein